MEVARLGERCCAEQQCRRSVTEFGGGASSAGEPVALRTSKAHGRHLKAKVVAVGSPDFTG